MKFYIRVFLVTLIATVLSFGLIAKIFIASEEKRLKKINEEIITENEEEGKKEEEKGIKKPDLNKLEGLLQVSTRINVLLLGLEGYRTDTIILSTYDPEEKNLHLITIPRDTYNKVPGYEELGQRKINSVFGYGKKNGGAKGVKAQISKLLKIPIHYYIMVDYAAISNIVDTVGEIEVDIKEKMEYDDVFSDPPLHIRFEKGRQKLNGKKAIEYLRWRKNNNSQGDGDIPRTQRQMDFLKKLLAKTLTSFKLNTLIDTLIKYVSTDLPLVEIIYLAGTAVGFDPDTDIHSHILPGEVIFDGLSYYKHDEKETDELLKNIFKKK